MSYIGSSGDVGIDYIGNIGRDDGGSIVVGACATGKRWRESARRRTDGIAVSWSLRWVGVLLPGDEGVKWWGEVVSCLAEASDDERRGYVRSYRRGVPQLIWTSWADYLSRARSRELS